jgi:hypothetical protein
MNGNQKQQMTPEQILAEGWRLTRAILGLKGMEIPSTINFQTDGQNHIRATRVATLEDLAKAVAAFDEAIEQDKANIRRLHRHLDTEELNRQRDALAELHKRASRGGDPASTTVIEALFPEVPVKKKTAAERAEIEHWLATRREEALKIDPETAEVYWWYTQTLDPYGVMDEWELPEEFDQIGREHFACAPGSDICVWFGDLPEETRAKLEHKEKPSFTIRGGELIWNIDEGSIAAARPCGYHRRSLRLVTEPPS